MINAQGNNEAHSTEPGTALLLAAAPAGKAGLIDAVSVLPTLAAVPPSVLTGTAAATVVELADPLDPQAVLTRLRTAAAQPGPLHLYVAGQLHLDQRQRLLHLALARTTPSTLRYTALPWHWLTGELTRRRAHTTTVVVDLVADAEAWQHVSAGGLGLGHGTSLYGRVQPPPPRRTTLTPTYLRACADIWRTGTQPAPPHLHDMAATQVGPPGALFVSLGSGQAPVAESGAGAPTHPAERVGATPAGPSTNPTPAPAPAQAEPPAAAQPRPTPAPAAPPARVTPAEASVAETSPRPSVPAHPEPLPAARTPEPASSPAPAPDAPRTRPAPPAAPAREPRESVAPTPAVPPAPAVAPTAPQAPPAQAEASVADSSPRPSVPAPPPAPATSQAPAVQVEPAAEPAPTPPVRQATAPISAAQPHPEPPSAPTTPASSTPPPAVSLDKAPPAAAVPPMPSAPPVQPAAAPAEPDPHALLLAAVQAGRHGEAASIAAAWEGEALRVYGMRSAEVVHWMEVRADLARLAGEPDRSCELWIAVAHARIARGESPSDEDVEAAVDRAHHQWEQVGEPDRARRHAAALTAVREQVPGRRPGALDAIKRRLDALPA
ncbi:hypothetical protein ABZY90_22705 [Streptomyces sp. NPDC006422]|uniref:hypothetical protein n=1 Tax=unclassified Streptomyces TaxID=2593676 RepID=UPI0033B997C5